jgi:RNase P subunit RPR2
MAATGYTLEEGYIVRRCRQCRTRALHAARLYLNENGTPRVETTCLKCGHVAGASLKPTEWQFFA